MTPNGRAMLGAVAANGGAATPAELIKRFPEIYPGDVRSVTASLHLTGSYLVGLGFLKRGRRQVRSKVSGQVQGGPRLYRLTPAGKAALR
jgi:hypothetical protein